jgi:protein gp37
VQQHEEEKLKKLKPFWSQCIVHVTHTQSPLTDILQLRKKTMARTRIEWTEVTWNPVTGCTKISPGCQHCYAERMAARLKAMGNVNYADGFRLTLQPHMLERPLEWKKPQMIFVNSMSDLFHRDVPNEYILKVIEVMHQAHWHQFQVLTKRADRLEEVNSLIAWPDNVWMGVSIEDQARAFRADHLRRTGAGVKFLSLEPLIGPVNTIDLSGIDWVIVGGESGPRCRPMEKEWVIALRDQCVRENVPFFFKQWGGVNKKKAGRELDGRKWSQMAVVDQPMIH